MRIVSDKSATDISIKRSRNLQKPAWLKIRAASPDTEAGKKFSKIRELIRVQKLHTVCSEASCPNAAECWAAGTATFMILGDTCTRACRFCNVKSGNPHGIIDKDEPQKLVSAVKAMGLNYVVLTCVTRDDLEDGGAGHFADCIKALKAAFPKVKIEVLISDLNGNRNALKKIVAAAPDVIAHNLETVKRLQKDVRDPHANYEKSLSILRTLKTPNAEKKPGAKKSPFTKSALMVGLGETRVEIIQSMKDMRAAGVDMLTIGQYLSPSQYHLPVKKYITPAQFKSYETVAKKLGFLYCASGPFVRSSYKAGELYIKGNEKIQ
jgi:lipoyl synthase